MKLKNFSNYEIYPEEGKIWSYKRNRFIGYPNESDGYWRVALTDDNGEKHYFLLSRVIWMTVNGEIPEGLEINHLDENKSNNSISNLELVDRKTNINYGTRNARVAEKLSQKVGAYKDGVLVMVFPSTMEAERQGFNSGAIAACCNGQRKSHRGFTWRYAS